MYIQALINTLCELCIIYSHVFHQLDITDLMSLSKCLKSDSPKLPSMYNPLGLVNFKSTQYFQGQLAIGWIIDCEHSILTTLRYQHPNFFMHLKSFQNVPPNPLKCAKWFNLQYHIVRLMLGTFKSRVAGWWYVILLMLRGQFLDIQHSYNQRKTHSSFKKSEINHFKMYEYHKNCQNG